MYIHIYIYIYIYIHVYIGPRGGRGEAGGRRRRRPADPARDLRGRHVGPAGRGYFIVIIVIVISISITIFITIIIIIIIIIIMSALRGEVEKLSAQLGARAARSMAAATLGSVGASRFPTVLSMAYVHARVGQPAEAVGGPQDSGIGQGRPVPGAGAADPGPGIGDMPGIGRGRALSPPPGLQRLPGARRPPPCGLSQFWTTAGPIPEEDPDPSSEGLEGLAHQADPFQLPDAWLQSFLDPELMSPEETATD